jgi:hypothetical protein
MATVKEINHDSGPPIGNHYSSVTDTDGAITVNNASALDGSVFGVEMDFSAGTNTVILAETFVFSATELRMRFWVDLSLVSHSGASVNTIKLELETSVGSVFDVLINYTTGTPTLRANYRIDNSDFIQVTGAKTLSATDFCIEMRAIRETADGNADGELEFYIDGISSLDPITDIDNFNKWNDGIDTVEITISSAASLSGDLYYDQWILDNVNTADLGCGPVQTLAPMTKPADIDASGTFIYVALLLSGTPILTKISTALNADGVTVFNPGAGTNIGVECGRFSSDIVWVAGNFDGTNVVEKSSNAGTTFSVKDDGTIGDVRTFVMGPQNDDRLMVFDETNGDILETRDDGLTWQNINAAVTPEVNAIARLGTNSQESVFGNDGAANNSINYSINSGADLEDYQTGVYPNQNATRVIIN